MSSRRLPGAGQGRARAAGLLAVLAAGLVMALAGDAQAQRKPRLPRHKLDPYTKNDPARMKKLGYVSYGPFEFGTRGDKIVTTEDVERRLSYADFRWVETAHFKIGSTLRAWTVPFEPKTRKKIRAELTRLREKLPKVNPKKRTLDPWLRLHLIAMRMEDTYADFRNRLGLKDEDFPAAPDKVIRGRGRYMGMGPYLGQTGKYLILVCDKGATYQDYLRTYIGRQSKFGQRWNFKVTGSLFYGIGVDLEGGRLKHDTALHCNLVFNVVHNLVDGFRFYSYNLPVWIPEGIAHWYQRRVDPRWNDFDQNEGGMADKKPLWKWEPKVRQLVAAGRFTPLSEVCTWRDDGQMKFLDHLCIWSRVDFMMTLGDDRFAQFMFVVKGRVDPETWLPDQSDLVGATREALRKAYGLTPLTFDERWKQWVLENYPTQ